MLEPNSRCTYLEELRPPAGYRLDRALATTYSLDLLTLLMAPLSIALNDCRNREDTLQDPIAVLEALRCTAGQLTVYCQNGRIAVPKKDTLLYRYLEPIVVAIQPLDDKGVFHSKTWLLRFAGEEGDDAVRYRFLCLSRNLTFDPSWDTVLSLEGCLQDRQNAYARNRPLSEFFAYLPKLAQPGLAVRHRDNAALMADEILRVKFEPPDGFEDNIRFFPLGIPGHNRTPHNDKGKRILVVSPFLNDATSLRLMKQGQDNILISRPESLDSLAISTIRKLEENTSMFFLDDNADGPRDREDIEADAANTSGAIQSVDCSGLHAKLYIIENGRDATVFSGSANATSAAMQGRNVELLVGLSGKKRQMGVEAFLGNEDSPVSFRGMLRRYDRREYPVEPDESQLLLDKAIETARGTIAGSMLSIEIVPAGDGVYDLTLLTSMSLELPAEIKARCFPISLNPADAQTFASGSPRFVGLLPEKLTGFVAFDLKAEKDGRKVSVGFVLNLPVSGMPDNRDQRVLQEIIKNPTRFIRYLLLILAEDEQALGPEFDSQEAENGESWRFLPGIPLLEEMVRAFSRHPEKMARIQKLMDDLNISQQDDAVLPKGFGDLWRAFQAAGTLRGSV